MPALGAEPGGARGDDAPLRFEGVAKRYGRAHVLGGVGLEVAEGESLAVLGANGSGKTTLLKLAATLLQPTAGRVWVLGRDTRREEARVVRRRIGFVGHEPLLYEELTARQNLRFFARLYGLADPDRTAESWLGRVALAARGHELVARYSRGMKQRLALARALLHEPSVLLLDEPFAGLDEEWGERAHGLLEAWRGEPGRALVLSTHGVEHAARAASRAVVLGRGRVAADVRRGDGWGAEALRRAYALATAGGGPA